MREDERGHIDKTGPKELAWFIGLWLIGVGVVLIVAGLIKLVL